MLFEVFGLFVFRLDYAEISRYFTIRKTGQADYNIRFWKGPAVFSTENEERDTVLIYEKRERKFPFLLL